MNKKMNMEWTVLCGALRNLSRERKTEESKEIIIKAWGGLNDNAKFIIRRDFVEDIMCVEKSDEWTDFFDSLNDNSEIGDGIFTEDEIWDIYLNALKYYAGRETIVSATFPSELIGKYRGAKSSAKRRSFGVS